MPNAPGRQMKWSNDRPTILQSKHASKPRPHVHNMSCPSAAVSDLDGRCLETWIHGRPCNGGSSDQSTPSHREDHNDDDDDDDDDNHDHDDHDHDVVQDEDRDDDDDDDDDERGEKNGQGIKKTRKDIEHWLRKNHTRKYFEWYVATNASGQPFKRDHKNRSLQFVYSKLDIPKELIRTDHARGIYWSPLYDNSIDYLNKRIEDKDLVKSFDTSVEALVDIWRNKHAKPRIKQLVKKGRNNNETLFYDDLTVLTWEQAKMKYLGQVGR